MLKIRTVPTSTPCSRAQAIERALTPTSSSWLNRVERWFRDLTDKAIRRGVFRSVPERIAAIEAYLAAHNKDPKPFIWTASADASLEKVRRGRVALGRITA